MDKYIRKFREIGMKDVPLVGGKNASLGEMFTDLASHGVRIPDGFATTAEAFRSYLKENELDQKLEKLLKDLKRPDYSNLNKIGEEARQLILGGNFSEDLEQAIIQAYKDLSGEKHIEVAVRSSATAEDLPQASFAGQHDSFLNISGEEALLKSVKNCFASLYTDRAIKYREDQGFEHREVALSVGVQKMVRSDRGSSGVGFTIDPESGFKDVIHLAGVWGLGENIVQGTVNPDEFYVFKPALVKEKMAIIQKKLGAKEKTMVYSGSNGHASTMNMDTESKKQDQFVLNDKEILALAKWALEIEEHYGKPMDIEWAKDGITNELFIIQARPETVHTSVKEELQLQYKLLEKGKVLAKGNAIGSKIAVGPARILESPREADKLQKGDILVTQTTSPDWDPLLKKVAGVVTDRGGRTSHAAIVARELGVPAVVGSGAATGNIKDGEIITVSCVEGQTGFIYQGELKFETQEIDFGEIKMPTTEAKLILADPERAFQLSFYPNNGVGLLRMEFIITHMVKVHPMALIKFDELKNEEAKKEISHLTRNYPQKEEYFVDQLSQGIATIAAAFYPKEVIVRMSDFKTNEYANLIGGKQFEPEEENPMLGFRGASRYYHDLYRQGFLLECRALKKVREEMGLENVKLMIPFCRTVEEGEKVVNLMAENGLKRGENGCEIYVMVEIPSNVLLLEEFARVFDGFSIGSNDLTQLTLGIDRDSQLISSLFDENNPAPKKMISLAIEKANKTGKKIGLCGQAPSDFPEFASFLVKAGINSISFNPDALIKGIKNIKNAEEEKEEPVV
ncbi:phosphoenolpyruvate synthase [Salinimicrobium sediminilitoris]|uniref:phosphoenolpyruvate synthase n=1 Tax=Salinimicrobium sediminilitoris TaxID=2876715 RepID=UPI001E34F9FB|nr:phosphoenolpyruvate synthase [Salinimicrobium sediminilitoris]MCC8360688.1 phosphoenolpyruvate synthase [Salinimicrobium sediminilitoris]